MSNMRRVRVIANPAARGGARDVVPQVIARLRALGCETRETWTRAPAEAIDVAVAAAREGFDTIVSVGGDGTAGEVAEGLARARGRWPGATSEATADPALVIVPAGTGNSMFRALWSDRPWEEVLDEIAAGRARVRTLDLGRVVGADRAFVLGASVGFLARVVEVAAGLDALAGRERYAAAAMQAMQTLQTEPVEVEVDGVELFKGSAVLVVAGGARHRSGVFEFLPRSMLDDGLLDVSVIEGTDASAITEIAALIVQGAHLDRPEVRYAQGSRIRISRTDRAPLVFERDGDLGRARGPVLELEAVPGAVRAWAPPDAPAG
ncbi:MAG: diacylglycerol kinase family protein [Actinomycetota bacterium]